MSDYIKREDAIAAADQYLDSNNNGADVAADFISAITCLPAAPVREVVRGKWIPVGLDDMDEGMYKCSECGSEHFYPEILLDIPADNFCPNCGADMREKGETI